MKLHVQSLAAERSSRGVFAGLDFTAEAGTLLRITGANGAGKTTLLRVLAGLGAPADGQFTWSHDTALLTPAQAACFVGHSNAFNDALTVRENLDYVAALADQPRTDAVAALEALGVRALLNRRFGALSQGQKKRCSLARLLLRPSSAAAPQRRRAWLLDEPFVALDVDSQAVLAGLMTQELAAGGMVIYTSHQAVPIAAANAAEVAL
ncbi:MAG: heme ABC exporter ATP-binding protein CcmA [Burkholderiales bacterium]|nr:heme ABC exporter ATP-binding protein CcmA [Burkholderiales bacterium]